MLLAVAVAGCSGSGTTPAYPRAAPVAERFLAAWSAGRLDAAAALTDAPTGARAALGEFRAAVRVDPAIDLGGTQVGGTTATTAYRLSWPLGGPADPWTYESSLTLTRDETEHWRVHWDPRLVHPRWRTGDRLRSTRTLPARAPLLDATGHPLFRSAATVTIGVDPRRVTDLDAVATALGRRLGRYGVTAADVRSAVRRGAPGEVAVVATLPRTAYADLWPELRSLRGTVLRPGDGPVPVDPALAPTLLGQVGPAGAEVLAEAGPPYAAGDELGTSGLQRALNGILTGLPGFRVSTVDSTGAPAELLTATDAVPGKPVRATLDPATQRAAYRALTPVRGEAALVAVRPSTGAILAVAQSGGTAHDQALVGRYPAGSAADLVTVSALLGEGVLDPTARVACPRLGQVPLRTAFARSCTPAFTALAQRLSPDGVAHTAAAYGIGAAWPLPVPVFPGQVRPDGITVSPLTMALLGATVARGRVPAPMLVAGSPAPAPAAPPDIPAGTLPVIRDLGRAVVTEGTASALRPYAGLAGATGTAPGHSWFVGWRDDLAFAVLTTGGQPAVPVADRFLAELR